MRLLNQPEDLSSYPKHSHEKLNVVCPSFQSWEVETAKSPWLCWPASLDKPMSSGLERPYLKIQQHR